MKRFKIIDTEGDGFASSYGPVTEEQFREIAIQWCKDEGQPQDVINSMKTCPIDEIAVSFSVELVDYDEWV